MSYIFSLLSSWNLFIWSNKFTYFFIVKTHVRFHSEGANHWNIQERENWRLYQKLSKKSFQILVSEFFGRMKQRYSCIRMMERENSGEIQTQLMTQSIPRPVPQMVETVLQYGHIEIPMEKTHCCLLIMCLLREVSRRFLRCIWLYCLLTFSQMLQHWKDTAS